MKIRLSLRVKRLCSIFLLALTPTLFAQQTSNTQQATQETGDILAKIHAELAKIYTRMGQIPDYEQRQHFKQNTLTGHIIAANRAKLEAQGPLKNVVYSEMRAYINYLLSYTPTGSVNDNYFANLPASDFPPVSWVTKDSPFGDIFGGTDKLRDIEEIKLKGDANFNINSLLGATYFQPENVDAIAELPTVPLNDEGKPYFDDHALNYIWLHTGMDNPSPMTDYEMLAQMSGRPIEQIINDPIMTKLRVAHRKKAAQKSVSIMHLLNSYLMRVPIKDLGIKSGIPENENPLGTHASQLQVEEYMAKRRLNTDWYQAMAEANATTIQREIAYLLAEMREEQFKQRQENERLLITMSMVLDAIGGANSGEMPAFMLEKQAESLKSPEGLSDEDREKYDEAAEKYGQGMDPDDFDYFR